MMRWISRGTSLLAIRERPSRYARAPVSKLTPALGVVRIRQQSVEAGEGMLPRDTHPEAHLFQLGLYRAMSLERKGNIAAQLSNAIRSVACSGIRLRHPDYSDAEACRALMALLFGETACYPTQKGSCPMVFDPTPFLACLVNALNQAGVPFMLAGSFASSMHGVPRATRDLDFVIDPTSKLLERLLGHLAREELYLDATVARAELRRRGQFNVIDPSTSWKADLIYRKDRAFSHAELERRVPVTVLGVPLFVATAEDTVLAKLEWAKLGPSERQLDDVRGIIEAQAGTLDRAYVERWLDVLGVRELWELVGQG